MEFSDEDVVFGLLVISVFAFVYVGVAETLAREVASFTWKFWLKEPYEHPNIGIYLLYPIATTLWERKGPIQEEVAPKHDFTMQQKGWHLFALPLRQFLYETERGAFGIMESRYLRSNVRERAEQYVFWSAWLWLPRLMLLVPLHMFAIGIHLTQAARWMLSKVLVRGV